MLRNIYTITAWVNLPITLIIHTLLHSCLGLLGLELEFCFVVQLFQ